MYKHSVYIRDSQGFFQGTGLFTRQYLTIHGEKHAPKGSSYFCPKCGQIWAEVPVHCSNVMEEFQVQGGYCKDHPGPSPFTVAGSLLLSWEPEYSALLLTCPDVVRWEFMRHLEFIERRIAE